MNRIKIDLDNITSDQALEVIHRYNILINRAIKSGNSKDVMLIAVKYRLYFDIAVNTLMK